MEHIIDFNKARIEERFRLSGKFFGTNPDGVELGFTNSYMIIGDKPFFAISGECHYSRVAVNQWEDTILKMKAGGINTISTYIFWNHHEEIEGEFDFSGRRNLKGFIELCKKHKMYVILRIGPFNHGEVRNGGLPDWLYGKPFEVRSVNAKFLDCVRKFYRAIYSQIAGLLYKDGGPIIGAQIDNEYMHSAAPWEMTTGISNEWVNVGTDGDEYMLALKKLAVEEGIITPFYTCTGWGGAATPNQEMLTLWGGYSFWPWMFYNNPDYVHPATEEYIYRDNHNNEVRTTYNFEPGYNPEDMPYACCEMGGGMTCYYNYRFQIPFEAIDAMANVKLGSGCNFLGYYMYRGGSNPHGKINEYLNEHQCPKISYDYQAPIGEFGQIRPSFNRLKRIHLFAKHFTELLCDTTTILASDNEGIAPTDNTHLRYCGRSNGKGGFLFINNYQDHLELFDKKNECLKIMAGDKIIEIKDLSIAAGESAIIPINMDLDGVGLQCATAQLLSRIENDNIVTYVFFQPKGMKAKFLFDDGDVVEPQVGRQYSFSKEAKEKKVRFVVLSDEESLGYNEIETKDEVISFISNQPVTFDGNVLRIEATNENRRKIVPVACGESRYIIKIPNLSNTAKDSILQIKYSGDIGNLFDSAGSLVSDNFCNGAVWEIGLNELKIEEDDELVLYITPKKENVVVDVSSTMAGRAEKVGSQLFSLDEVAVVETIEKEIKYTEEDNFVKELKENGINVL